MSLLKIGCGLGALVAAVSVTVGIVGISWGDESEAPSRKSLQNRAYYPPRIVPEEHDPESRPTPRSLVSRGISAQPLSQSTPEALRMPEGITREALPTDSLESPLPEFSPLPLEILEDIKPGRYYTLEARCDDIEEYRSYRHVRGEDVPARLMEIFNPPADPQAVPSCIEGWAVQILPGKKRS